MEEKLCAENVNYRLNKIRILAPKGCSCISFYDFIRCYPYEWLCNFNKVIVPLDFLTNHLEIPWNFKEVLRHYSWSEIQLYPNFKKYIWNEPLYRSWISDIPISLVIQYKHLKWDWEEISIGNTTFQEKDILALKYKLNFQYLSLNPTILLDWILNHPELNWDYDLISQRLTIHEIDRLYKSEHRDKLNFSLISTSYLLTAEDILSRPSYPWKYSNLDHPTLDYYLRFKDQYHSIEFLKYSRLVRSKRISISDLNHPDLSINYDEEFISELTYNPNLTLDHFNMFKERDRPIGDRFQQPKLQKYYQNLYSNIIQEIKLI